MAIKQVAEVVVKASDGSELSFTVTAFNAATINPASFVSYEKNTVTITGILSNKKYTPPKPQWSDVKHGSIVQFRKKDGTESLGWYSISGHVSPTSGMDLDSTFYYDTSFLTLIRVVEEPK